MNPTTRLNDLSTRIRLAALLAAGARAEHTDPPASAGGAGLPICVVCRGSGLEVPSARVSSAAA